MEDVYCAVCGVVFDVCAHVYRIRDEITPEVVAWTEQCISVYADKTASPTFHLSGIASYWWSLHSSIRKIPPIGYDGREKHENEYVDDSSWLGGDPFTECHLFAQGVDYIAYPMHVPCWSILLQQFASLAPMDPSNVTSMSSFIQMLGTTFSAQQLEPESRGLRPDWTTDYNGPEEFWDDGWTNVEDIDASSVAVNLDHQEQWDYLVYNPDATTTLQRILAEPPLITQNQATTEGVTNVGDLPTSPPKTHTLGLDSLPAELRSMILELLPSTSVANLRLASRTMSTMPLASRFWRSRFQYPHELSHVALSSGLQLFDQYDEATVDWHALYESLMSLKEEDCKGWANRRRIARLCQRLTQRIISGEPLVDRHSSVGDNGKKIAVGGGADREVVISILG